MFNIKTAENVIVVNDWMFMFVSCSLSNTGLTFVSGFWMKRGVLREQRDTKQSSVHRVLKFNETQENI